MPRWKGALSLIKPSGPRQPPDGEGLSSRNWSYHQIPTDLPSPSSIRRRNSSIIIDGSMSDIVVEQGDDAKVPISGPVIDDAEDSDLEWTPEEERRLVRKCDRP